MLLTSADQWITYFGRFHPLVVHLPIGILFVVFVLELPFIKRKIAQPLDTAIIMILGLGSITALLSCLLGWLLSWEGNYDENTLMLHQWMGMAVALVSGICWSIKRKNKQQPGKNPYYTALLIFLFLSLLLTGHWGGSMTHGEDYLTAAMPAFGASASPDTTTYKRKLISNINEALVYEDLVQNVLAEKCYSCHSSKKTKGGLRVDDEKLLFKGGKHGVVIEAGKPEESELLIRVLLPEDDDKRMPPKKKNALTKEEVALLQWWIQNGAATKKRVQDIASSASILPMLNSFVSDSAKNSSSTRALSAIFEKELSAPDLISIEALTKLGILVSPIAKNKNLLDVSCINYSAFDDSKMPLLLKLSDHIVSLKMDNTAISDAALEDLGKFTNLVRLNIAQTNISGSAIKKLQSLKGLEYLNIVGTKVDDKGLLALATLPAIKHIYCWNSLVTTKGITAAYQKNPGVVIEAGAVAK